MPWSILQMLSPKSGLHAVFTSMLTLALTGLAGFAATPSVRYIPPPDRGTPTSDRGTGSRGDCLYRADLQPMAALVGEAHLSLTVSDRPTLWAYLPYTVADASYAEVILQVESGDEEIYRGSFPLAASPGVMGIRFPDSMPTLEVGKAYRWYIDIPCTPADLPAGLPAESVSPTTAAQTTPATLTGVVKRVAASSELTQSLQIASTVAERLVAYGEHHIWYDLLSELAERRLIANADPQFEQLWVDVLSDEAGANLADYAEAPLVGEVTAQDVTASFQ